MNLYRSHNCGELNTNNINEDVYISGWINKIRDHGGVLFVDLRDEYGLTQCVVNSDNPKFKDKDKENWLPEIFQIGVRNPQGMDLSPFDNKIYLTNHGAKGGDWFGEAKFGENYGWKILGWGGTNYSGTKIGPKWKPGFTKAIKYWVPSIAVSSMIIYKGVEF